MLLLPVLFFSGCASLSKGSDISVYSPVAIVTVASNGEIKWYNEEKKEFEENDGLLTKIIRKENGKTAVSNADELVSAAEAVFLQRLLDSGIAEFAEKDEILQSDTYQKAESDKRREQAENVAAEGYKFINPRNKDFINSLSIETGCMSVMFVDFVFAKEMVSGFGKSGKLRAVVFMTGSWRDTAGKSLYQQTFTLRSDDTIQASMGKYDDAELMMLFESVIPDICNEFIARF